MFEASMEIFSTMISSYEKYRQSQRQPQECKQFAIAPSKLFGELEYS
jgi:hypothetical protein